MDSSQTQSKFQPVDGHLLRVRRPRYSGKYPRRFEEKYKELSPAAYSETVAKVLASGKTPAGTHRPIMVREALDALSPRPGEVAVDCTLGYGGHSEAILPFLLPGGFLLGLDQDPIELPKAEARLRAAGFSHEVFSTVRTNFAGLPQALAKTGLEAANVVIADLGISSMQLDDPRRGFSMKAEGPLDLRMNPSRGQPARAVLARIGKEALGRALAGNDEPRAALLSEALAGREFPTTTALASAVRKALPRGTPEEGELTVRRVFQTLRILVNDELSTLETLLRHLPSCLKPGGRAAILTFHSGEDRRVKKAFIDGVRQGVYAAICGEPVRPAAEERRANPRSASAKLRWVVKVA